MKTFATLTRTAAPAKLTPRPGPADPGRGAAIRQILHGPRLQAKLTVGAPDDAYEREADRTADQVMRMPEPGGRVQRMCSHCQEELQRQPAGGGSPAVAAGLDDVVDSEVLAEAAAGGAGPETEEVEVSRKPSAAVPTVSAGFERELRAAVAAGGRPLPAAARGFMEERMGHGFAGVRVHTDAASQDLAQRVAARAFTVGGNIFFGPGEYRPETREGRRLVAHELAHVVQQGGSGPAVQREPLLLQRAAHPCPKIAEPDSSKDVETFNCTGLANRNYQYLGMTETKKIHSAMKSIGCGDSCGQWGIKHWYWEYDLHGEDSAGNKGKSHRDFHTVGGMLDENGKDFNYFWSKNGKRPISPRASGASWKPPAKEQDRENNKGNKLKVDPSGQPIYKVRSNYAESCFCGSCPT